MAYFSRKLLMSSSAFISLNERTASAYCIVVWYKWWITLVNTNACSSCRIWIHCSAVISSIWYRNCKLYKFLDNIFIMSITRVHLCFLTMSSSCFKRKNCHFPLNKQQLEKCIFLLSSNVFCHHVFKTMLTSWHQHYLLVLLIHINFSFSLFVINKGSAATLLSDAPSLLLPSTNAPLA